MIMEFMGKKHVINSLHVCDFMVNVNKVHNPTTIFTIYKLIDISGTSVMRKL
jgi:hypothetical protein